MEELEIYFREGKKKSLTDLKPEQEGGGSRREREIEDEKEEIARRRKDYSTWRGFALPLVSPPPMRLKSVSSIHASSIF